MKRKTIVSLIFSLLAIALLSVSVYASYSFARNIIVNEIEVGKIQLLSNNILIRDDQDPNKTYIPTTNKSVSCYATEKGGYSDEVSEYPYLNQIGASFEFKNEVDVYVRIYFQQAWLSHKVYRNGISTNTYIPFNTDALESAFSSNTAWEYNSHTGYLYLKTKVSGTNANVNSTNKYSFYFSDTYFYQTEENVSYREAIIVDFSYHVDIVQANRASTLWGFDVDSYLNALNEEE